ncbi:CgeB family protein [Mucilaginibacter lacusdianchii]|uniref:CgeB family protein n=1 Tax=Mucilaginibacter lacusdianchii TaxID=2684211 RepID=UPI00131D87AE|nr:glycosyltransferase [Mucilaginibacter sp. JXJ CY 39]
MANILYMGDINPGSTSAQRALALERLGHTVIAKTPYGVFKTHRFEPIHYRTGYRLVQGSMLKWVKSVIDSLTIDIDVVWIDSGELLGPKCVKALKTLGCPVLLYNVDDPTGKRDGRKFDLLIKAITLYDAVFVVRKESEEDCKRLGVKQVTRVFRSYDEVAHKPFDKLSDIPPAFRSDVAFIGTWMRHENREKIFLELIKNNISFKIWGPRWEKSPQWDVLKPYYGGGSLSGREYVAAIQGAKICLGLLSKGNRDLHTQRSLEVPYAAGLFCAERTSEHQELYKEGVEAVFWADEKECAAVCKKLLEDNTLREQIRLSGMKRVKSLGLGNEDICRNILNEVLAPVLMQS